jgi:hypothetical protein
MVTMSGRRSLKLWKRSKSQVQNLNAYYATRSHPNQATHVAMSSAQNYEYHFRFSKLRSPDCNRRRLNMCELTLEGSHVMSRLNSCSNLDCCIWPLPDVSCCKSTGLKVSDINSCPLGRKYGKSDDMLEIENHKLFEE